MIIEEIRGKIKNVLEFNENESTIVSIWKYNKKKGPHR
jgi:hypothetical protein